MAYDEEEDPMAVDDIDGEDEDELELGDGEDFLSEFDPYGGEEDHGEPEDEATDQELPTNKARVNRARINRGRISKDDAASSFGEKDEDIPGNRQLDPDHKDKDAGEYLIQGGPSDGQAVQKALRKAVRAELISAGLIRKADGPRVGANTKLEKSAPAPTQAELFEKMKGRSFREINQLRVELGDLPAGII